MLHTEILRPPEWINVRYALRRSRLYFWKCILSAMTSLKHKSGTEHSSREPLESSLPNLLSRRLCLTDSRKRLDQGPLHRPSEHTSATRISKVNRVNEIFFLYHDAPAFGPAIRWKGTGLSWNRCRFEWCFGYHPGPPLRDCARCQDVEISTWRWSLGMARFSLANLDAMEAMWRWFNPFYCDLTTYKLGLIHDSLAVNRIFQRPAWPVMRVVAAELSILGRGIILWIIRFLKNRARW